MGSTAVKRGALVGAGGTESALRTSASVMRDSLAKTATTNPAQVVRTHAAATASVRLGHASAKKHLKGLLVICLHALTIVTTTVRALTVCARATRGSAGWLVQKQNLKLQAGDCCNY